MKVIGISSESSPLHHFHFLVLEKNSIIIEISLPIFYCYSNYCWNCSNQTTVGATNYFEMMMMQMTTSLGCCIEDRKKDCWPEWKNEYSSCKLLNPAHSSLQYLITSIFSLDYSSFLLAYLLASLLVCLFSKSSLSIYLWKNYSEFLVNYYLSVWKNLFTLYISRLGWSIIDFFSAAFVIPLSYLADRV